jgi:hypothetical protein
MCQVGGSWVDVVTAQVEVNPLAVIMTFRA